MVKEATLPEEVYDQPWELVVEAYMRRYPTHERIPVMLGSEVLEHETAPDTGVEKIVRLVTLDVEAPNWVKRTVKQYDFQFIQTTTIDRKARKLVMSSVNKTYEGKLDILETAVYAAVPEEPDKTSKNVNASMKLPRFPLSGTCEKFMIKSYTKNTAKGRELDLAFFEDVLGDGWVERGGREASPYYYKEDVSETQPVQTDSPALRSSVSRASRTSSADDLVMFSTPPLARVQPAGQPPPDLQLPPASGRSSANQFTPTRSSSARSRGSPSSFPASDPYTSPGVRRRGSGSTSSRGGHGRRPTPLYDAEVAPLPKKFHGGSAGESDMPTTLIGLNIAALSMSAISLFRPSLFIPAAVCLIVCVVLWYNRRKSTTQPPVLPDDGWDTNRIARGRFNSDVAAPAIDDSVPNQAMSDIPLPDNPAIVSSDVRRFHSEHGGSSGHERDVGTSQTSDGGADIDSPGLFGIDEITLRSEARRRGHDDADGGNQGDEGDSDEVEATQFEVALDLDDRGFVEIDGRDAPKFSPQWEVSVTASVSHADPLRGVWYVVLVHDLTSNQKWAVSRRYAEFRALDQALRTALSGQKWALVTLPMLPPKSLSKRSLAKRDLRREGLEAYLIHLTRNEYVHQQTSLGHFLARREGNDSYLTAAQETTIGSKVLRRHSPVNATFRVLRALQRAAWRDEWMIVTPTSVRFVDCDDPRSVVLEVPLAELIDYVYLESPPWDGVSCAVVRTARLRIHIAADTSVLSEAERAIRLAARDAPNVPQTKQTIPTHFKDGNAIVLNRQTICLDAPCDAEPLSIELLRTILRIGNAEHGTGITHSLASTAGFSSFVYATAKLQVANLHPLDEDGRMAFFLNVYHTLVLHALVDIGPPSSVMQRKSFYNNICYEVAGRLYSLADIEHGILRATSSRPAIPFQSLFIPSMKTSDARARYSLNEAEPRVTFALNTGCVSSTDLIFVYTSSNLDKQLSAASRVFCASNIAIEGHRARVTLPRILEWYAADFGSTKAEVLRRLAEWLPPADRQLLLSMVYVADASNIKLVYRDFVWQFRTVFHEGDVDALFSSEQS